MKTIQPRLLLVQIIVLTCLTSASLPGQAIQSGNFSFQIGFDVTLTTPGPVIVIGDAKDSYSIDIDGRLVASIPANSVVNIGFDYTSGTLAVGSHSILVSSGQSGGGATVIAPNEPPTGVQSAIDSLNNQIASLQQAEQTDAANIASLQATQGNQASQISALQTAETNDASQIASLQSQLQAINNALQARLTKDEADIAALQTGQSDQSGQISTLQTEVAQLQQEVNALQTELAAQPGPASSGSTSQYEALQNQIESLKSSRKDQWLAIGGVGLLGATGTAISAYELSQGGDGTEESSAQKSNSTSTHSSSSYNPYRASTNAYTKKN